MRQSRGSIGRFEETLNAGKHAVAMAPLETVTRKLAAISLAQLGRTSEARLEIAELLKYQPGVSLALF